MYDKDMRAAAESIRDLLIKNTLTPNNKCDFDMSEQEQSILYRKKLNEDTKGS